ncbi:MmyB family transcriptional regulator [Kineococcus indalonis]|uniref:MmyB family transcriptional regulator n=1 Tax=Kineococcus indalonis TaxID=2696566 RepID=UPI0014121BFB|nr:helix-turn-helix domain-containing protein [Kineococcus indalonis]NAZ84877.1 helix-turn-helix domain-containing protein [Kineococcus indalonis]
MVDRRPGIGAFLRARRDALQPEDVGLAREPGRRVPGLRREEVARLARISPEYYLRLEQGRDHLPSEQVLAALAGALRLDAAGREYLLGLALPSLRPRPGAGGPAPVDPALVAVVEHLGGVAAFVADANKDVVAANALARAAGSGAWAPGRNLVLDAFAPRVKACLPGWERLARRMVAALRLSGDPVDPRLQEVVGTLSVRDEDFRRWWAAHEVEAVTSGRVHCHLREGAGPVELRWQDLDVPGRTGHVLTVVHADPGSPGEAALAALAVLAERARERVPRPRGAAAARA